MYSVFNVHLNDLLHFLHNMVNHHGWLHVELFSSNHYLENTFFISVNTLINKIDAKTVKTDFNTKIT